MSEVVEDPTPSAPSVLGTWTHAIVRALDARGVDGRAVAAQAGLALAGAGDPDARYALAGTSRLWRLAVEATGDPCFGLWASRFVDPTTFHALGYAVFASGTLRDAFRRFERYGRLVSDAAKLELRDAADRACLCWSFPERAARPADEAMDAITSLVARTAWVLSARTVRPLEVRLARPEPTPSAAFPKVFRVPVRFGADETALAFATADVDAPLPAANAELARGNDEIVSRYLSRMAQARTSDRLRRWLLDRLPAGEPGQAAAARALGMSQRSLQRSLRDEGLTYRDVLDGTRREFACSYLDEGRSSVAEIAFLLGFADASSFSHAFRRLTGVSPRAYGEERRRGRGARS